MDLTASHQHPACPRCGYDLRGALDAWPCNAPQQSPPSDQSPRCPLQDTCPECGYTFLWRDLLNPEYQDLRGFYEHARTLGEHIRWGFRTSLWLLFPWVFWGKLKLHHRRKPSRAITLGIWLIVLSLFMRAAVASVVLLVVPFPVSPPLTWWYTVPGYARGVFHTTFGDHFLWDTNEFSCSDPVRWIILHLCLIAFSLAFAALIVWGLPETRRKARLLPAHAWRAAAYVIYPVGMAAFVRAIFACAEVCIDAAVWSTGNTLRSLGNPFSRQLMRDSIEVAPALWLIAYWSAAVLRGWRIRHGALTCLLLTISAATFSAIVASLVYLLFWPSSYSWGFYY